MVGVYSRPRPKLYFKSGSVEIWRAGAEDFLSECDADGECGECHHFKDGEFHRDDGPAIHWPHGVLKVYYRSGKRHRLNGPADERTEDFAKWSGVPTKRWFIEGAEYTGKEFTGIVERVKYGNLFD